MILNYFCSKETTQYIFGNKNLIRKNVKYYVSDTKTYKKLNKKEKSKKNMRNTI